jgi:ATP-dependent Lhr-like helicase
MGGRMPLSTELASAVRDRFEALHNGRMTDPEIRAVSPMAKVQSQWSALPGSGQLLVEKINTREGRHLFVYPFEGHRVNEGLGALLAYRISRLTPITISVAVNDYGLELLSDREIPLDQALRNGLFDTRPLLEDILESLNAAEMARRQFREIARVAGLVFQGYPGRRKSGFQLQGSSSLLYAVFRKYDPDNLLLAQSTREVLENQLEYHRLKGGLQRLSSSELIITEPPHPTPLAFPIMVNRLRTRISSEKLAERVRRMQRRLEKAADKRG